MSAGNLLQTDRVMKKICLSLIVASWLMAGPAGAEDPQAIEAVTAAGDKVVLHPNGRWEYVDPVKAAQAAKTADTFPENQARPVEAQGGLFGIGRTVMPGDKDYNRGSLNPKLR